MTPFLPQSPNFPRLHQSTANTLLNQCPRAAWYYHADLGGHEKPGSAATKRGNVLDRMIFGVGPEIVVLDFGDYKSKAAQAARLEAEAAGKLPVLLEPYEKHRLFVEAVLHQLREEHGIEFKGESQVTLQWDARENGVPCEGRLDHLLFQRLDPPRIMIWDLKTCRDASEEAVARSIVKYGYHIQHAAYVEAASVLNPKAIVEMEFLFAETEAPFLVRRTPLAGTMKSLGEYQWARACRIWKDCVENNSFPGYPVTRIEAKPYQLTQAVEEGDEEMEFRG
jgi:hypothetical protein